MQESQRFKKSGRDLRQGHSLTQSLSDEAPQVERGG